MEKLSGAHVAGFVDGEGCFALKLRRDIRYKRKNKPTYIYWDIEFAIVLREDDKKMLEKIQSAIGCGLISGSQKGHVRYAVNKLEELLYKVVPFFEKYPLQSKKRYDFELWKKALHLLYKNKGIKTNIRSTGHQRGARQRIWNPTELKKLKEIYEAMKNFKAKKDEWKWISEV